LGTRALQAPPRALYDGAALTFQVDPREEQMVAALKEGDDRAFAWLVDQHHAMLVRLALRYVPDMATAEDVTQETWLHVLRGLSRFEFRSSLKTWIVSILKNRARTRATRERRNTPVSDLWLATVSDEPAVDPDRFFGLENPALVDRWASAPRGVAPEEQLLASETQAIISQAIQALPLAQREVITLRDIEGWPSADVCNALGLTESNQRVLLHRARSKVRAAIEPYLSPTEQP